MNLRKFQIRWKGATTLYNLLGVPFLFAANDEPKSRGLSYPPGSNLVVLSDAELASPVP